MNSLLKRFYYKLSPTRRGILQIERMLDRLTELEEQSLERYREIALSNSALERKTDHLDKKLQELLEYLAPMPNHFMGHYEYWRMKRVTAIVEYYGESWFRGKKVLELGCGYGDIGHIFATLGAEVVFAEGRAENCEVLRRRYPGSRIYQMNCENEWPFPEDEQFDLILHMGLLYHLNNFEFSLEKCLAHTRRLVLETEVCDSTDPNLILKPIEQSENYDQSLTGQGSRPSAAYLEHFLTVRNWDYEQVKDSRCNAMFHVYDWPVKNTNTWCHGLRRFWFCIQGANT